jgi:ferredoxin
MKVVVEDTCIGCGLCVEGCPEVFELNDKNMAVVKVDPVPAGAQESCREAAGSCPVDAIKISE